MIDVVARQIRREIVSFREQKKSHNDCKKPPFLVVKAFSWNLSRFSHEKLKYSSKGKIIY